MKEDEKIVEENRYLKWNKIKEKENLENFKEYLNDNIWEDCKFKVGEKVIICNLEKSKQ